jgi:phosphate transport system permease protein
LAVAEAAAPVLGPRRPADNFRRIITIVSLAAPVVLIAVVLIVGKNALPAVNRFGSGFLFTRTWDPVREQFGALPMIYGTLVSSAVAMLIAIPVGLGVAMFLAEPGAAGIRGAIGVGVELLAAIPSVVYGIWGLLVLAPWLLVHFSQPLSQHLGSFPLFAPPAGQLNLLIAGIVLAIMVLPTLASISRDVIKAVPGGMREAGFALGATWWETMRRVVLPAARTGIFGAAILALGRALGETMAVTMVIGNTPRTPASLFQPGYTLAATIANEFREATGTLYPAALLYLGLVLMLVTLTVNILALLLVRSVSSEARI